MTQKSQFVKLLIKRKKLMINNQQGPKYHLTLRIECGRCEYLKSEYYFVEDGNSCDSGFDYWCSHSSQLIDNKPRAFSSSYHTPEWCPFLKQSEKTIEEKVNQELNRILQDEKA